MMPPFDSVLNVAVVPSSEYAGRRRIFDALEGTYPVRFVPCEASRVEDVSGAVVFGPDDVVRFAQRGLPCLQLPCRPTNAIPATGRVQFSDSPWLHSAFRGQQLADGSINSVTPLGENSGTVLARIDGVPCWVMMAHGSGVVYEASVPVPNGETTGSLRERFVSSDWMSLLPLFHFVHNVTSSVAWQQPPLRACFIVDDPNLHRPNYGYIDFQALAHHAKQNSYHVAIATIPFDAWYINRKAASIFRDNRENLSLLMHGVHHTADELARDYDPAQLRALLSVGLKRVAQFEESTGLSISRVMAAPHGAFTKPVADEMLNLGYESACVSWGSLVHWNRGHEWPAYFGFPLAHFFDDISVPVFHRIPLSDTEMRLSVFLNHPVVMTCHHQDLSGGLGPFATLASALNGIGPVHWTDAGQISRTNYLTKKHSGTLAVKSYSRLITLDVAGVNCVMVRPDWSAGTILTIHRDSTGRFTLGERAPEFPVTLQASGPDRLDIFFPSAVTVDADGVRLNLHVWPVVRRILCEARDRVSPFVGNLRSL